MMPSHIYGYISQDIKLQSVLKFKDNLVGYPGSKCEARISKITYTIQDIHKSKMNLQSNFLVLRVYLHRGNLTKVNRNSNTWMSQTESLYNPSI